MSVDSTNTLYFNSIPLYAAKNSHPTQESENLKIYPFLGHESYIFFFVDRKLEGSFGVNKKNGSVLLMIQKVQKNNGPFGPFLCMHYILLSDNTEY